MTTKYTAAIKFPTTVDYPIFTSGTMLLRDDVFFVERTFEAENRGEAVKKAVRYFWAKFVGSGLSPSLCLTVDDPNSEVTYQNGSFHCVTLRNMYLTDDVINRLVTESGGYLVKDNKNGNRYGHPLGSVRRRKRYIGSFSKAVAPCIYKSKAGTFFYMVTTVLRKSVDGVFVEKSKVKTIKLASRSLAGAIAEIRTRRLGEQHKGRIMHRWRSLKLAEYVAGLTKLTPDDKKYFGEEIVMRCERLINRAMQNKSNTAFGRK